MNRSTVMMCTYFHHKTKHYRTLTMKTYEKNLIMLILLRDRWRKKIYFSQSFWTFFSKEIIIFLLFESNVFGVCSKTSMRVQCNNNKNSFAKWCEKIQIIIYLQSDMCEDSFLIVALNSLLHWNVVLLKNPKWFYSQYSIYHGLSDFDYDGIEINPILTYSQ